MAASRLPDVAMMLCELSELTIGASECWESGFPELTAVAIRDAFVRVRELSQTLIALLIERYGDGNDDELEGRWLAVAGAQAIARGAGGACGSLFGP